MNNFNVLFPNFRPSAKFYCYFLLLLATYIYKLSIFMALIPEKRIESAQKLLLVPERNKRDEKFGLLNNIEMNYLKGGCIPNIWPYTISFPL